MKTVKMTIGEITEKIQLIENNIPGGVNDQLNHAVKRCLKRAGDATKPYIEQFQDDLQDLFVKNASVDDKGILLEDGDKYRFTPEKQAIINAERRKMIKKLNAREVEFEPYYAIGDFPRMAEIDLFVREELEGFLFSASPEKQRETSSALL